MSAATAMTVLLLEACMLPVPEEVAIVSRFGHERVSDRHHGKQSFGEVVLVQAEQDVLRDWLAPLSNFWTSTAPDYGWRLVQIKP